MIRRLTLIPAVVVVVLGVTAPGAAAKDVQQSDFRYTRNVDANAGGPVILEPDGSLFVHSQDGFADLRVVDALGQQVPWRRLPRGEAARPQEVVVLNTGRQGDEAVALLDLGQQRRVRDQVVLDIPERDFVGRVAVLGADQRGGPFTQLSETGIYDIQGGTGRTRSTVAVFPPSDFRYLQLRAAGVGQIQGATVSGAQERPVLIRRDARKVSRTEQGSRSVITLDLGYERIPVDELQIEADTPRYDRSVSILGSNDGHRFEPLADASVSRFEGSPTAPIDVHARHRYLRVEIENGDDPPLKAVQVDARSRSYALLLEGGHRVPYTLFYGNPAVGSPSYDYARLPDRALALQQAVGGRLGNERKNPGYEPPADTRSFSARHPGVVTAALALAALALGAVGLLVMRSRPAAGPRAE